jgi:two-component system phosphate regulon sensor histidine kinase PhoR
LRLGVRLKLFLVSLGLIAIGFAAVEIYLRAALDQDVVDRAHLQGLIGWSAGSAVVIAIAMSSLASHWMASLVRSLTSTARRMADGNLDARTRVGGSDEVAELGVALDQLASSLSDAMSDLRSERDLLGGVLDAMEEGVLVLARHGEIVRVNPALRAMLLLGSDAIGRPLIEVVRNADLKELVDLAAEGEATSQRGQITKAASREIETAGLKPRTLLVRASRLPGDALLVVCRDVTAVRRLETMRRDFVANVSHELRTPVTSVQSAAETLREGAASDPQAAGRFVDIIERNAERLKRLIEDLLDLSRIEAREFRLSREPISVRPFLEHVLSLFRERAEKSGLRVRVEVPESLPSVHADRRALEQIVLNLADNAIKYCPGATLTLRGEDRGDRVALVVADTGPGIEAKHLPRLFERFYRVDAGRSRELGGTGLGLSIVKHLGEAMGGPGSITVKSEVGKGTTFTVLLPRAEDTSAAVVAQA